MMRWSWYVPMKSGFHSLNSVLKINITLCIWVLSLTFQQPLWNGLLFCLTCLPFFTSRRMIVALKEILKYVSPIMFIYGILWPFFLVGGKVYLNYHASFFTREFTIELTQLGISWAIMVAFRLGTLMVAALLLLSTTKETEVLYGMLKFRIPYAVAFVFLMAIRLVPLALDDIQTIIDSRKARGIKEEGGLIYVMKNVTSLMIPLFLIFLRRVQIISNALEMKCFGSSRRVTTLLPNLSIFDKIAISLLLVAVALLLYLRIHLGMFALIPSRI